MQASPTEYKRKKRESWVQKIENIDTTVKENAKCKKLLTENIQCREPYWGAMPPGRNLTLTKMKFFSQPLSRNSCVSHNPLHLGWSTQTKVKFFVPPDLQIPELSRWPTQLPEQWSQCQGNSHTSSPEHILEFGGRVLPETLKFWVLH